MTTTPKRANFIQKLSQLKEMKSDLFVTDSLWMLFLNVIVSALNYLFLYFAAFLLSTSEFGILSAAIGVLTLFLIFTNVLQLDVTFQISNFHSSGSAKNFVRRYLKRVLLFAILPLSACLIFANELAGLMHANSNLIYTLVLSFLAVIAACIYNGLTSGLSLLKYQANINFLSTLAKFIFGLVLIYSGLGASGGIAGYFIGYLAVIVGSIFLVSKVQTSDECASLKNKTNSQNNIISCGVIYFLLVSPFVFDQIFIQHFKPSFSGEYAAVGLLGKLIFFICAPLFSAFYTHGCLAKTKSELKKLIDLSILGVLGTSLIFILSWLVLKNFIGGILLPTHYQSVIPYVLTFSLGIALHCFSYVLALLALIRQNFKIIVALLPILPLQYILFAYKNHSLEELVLNQLLIYGLQFALLFLYFSIHREKRVN